MMQNKKTYIQFSALAATIFALSIGSLSAQTNTSAQKELYKTEIKGQLQPVTHATISSKMTGSITAINIKDSERFASGDKLVEFDCSMERAELKKAKAAHNADLARKSVNTRLDKLSSISELEYKVALYKADESAAEIEAITQKIRYCTIYAPYDGVIEGIMRQPYEYVSKGDPVLDILDDSTLEIELLLPSQWITRMKVGDSFSVHVSELNKEYQAKISTIGAKIDPVSQSLKIKGQINNQSKELKPGMSITADFE